MKGQASEVKHWFLAVFLVGCQASTPTPVVTPSAVIAISETPAATASPTPVTVATATPTPPSTTFDSNDAVRATARFVHFGMTNQGRCDMLVAHLGKAGKDQLWLTWECYPAADGLFEVTYVIEPLSNLTSGKKPTVGKRGNPFDRPRRIHNNGVYLEWLYDFNKKTCVARNERTSALMELRPSLDSASLETALPASWQTATVGAAEVVSAPPIEIPATAAVQSVSSEPIQFTGFMGTGSGRRAVLTQSSETFAVGLGDKVGSYRVKSVAEDELELQQGEDTVRLMPGQVWTP